ncbi:hypothetical protein B0T22DRAFT_481658 [Podospora appendiculata]|uniref:NACHT-NTPase and P-loop NTPases N-terminal domain-containing protein n=1 Tax=Podospora appendiculata TaxID=314037 RepID=A0AAE1CE94_9PEZI|nr:hypothetical protein B0T22DRAFT_481658 [Podospora appendiculata]
MATLGLGEIIAIVSLAAQVVSAAEKVASIFDSIHNAPKVLRKLYVSVHQLEQNFKDLEEAINDSPPIKSPLDRQTIQQTLEKGEKLLQDCESTLRQGPWGNVIWPILREKPVEDYIREIEHMQLVFFSPVWSQLTYTKLRQLTAQHAPIPLIPFSSAELEKLVVETPRAVIPVPQLNDPEPPLVLEQRLREGFRTVFGLSVGEPEHDISLEWPETWEPIQTTLHLDSPNITTASHRKLELAEVQIMYRNHTSRILHFRNAAHTLRVKHVVPLDCVPWSSTHTPRSVTFLATHYITVVDAGENHHLYSVSKPRYDFERTKARRRFVSLARERSLVDEFLALEMTASGIGGDGTLTKCQVVRLWSRHENGEGRLPVVTMTFLATRLDDGKTHQEWDLRGFAHKASFLTRVLGVWVKSSRPSELVELSSFAGESAWGRVLVKFESAKVAENFKDCFESIYPRYKNTTAPRLDWSPPSLT